LFNAADAASIASLYHEEAVNHKLANTLFIDKKAIQKMFEAEFKAAEMRCIPEYILENDE